MMEMIILVICVCYVLIATVKLKISQVELKRGLKKNDTKDNKTYRLGVLMRISCAICKQENSQYLHNVKEQTKGA